MAIGKDMKNKIEQELQQRMDDGEWTKEMKKEYLEALEDENTILKLKIKLSDTVARLYSENPKELNVAFEYENHPEYLNAKKELQLIEIAKERKKFEGMKESTEIQINYIKKTI